MGGFDTERFRTQINNPRRTQAELEQMRRNAIDKHELEAARLVQDALDDRFPGWNSTHHKDSRSRPAVVTFNGERMEFPTSKGAYVWLIERFISVRPEPFRTINWETKFIAKGSKRNHFGRTPERMYHSSPHLANDPNNYARLSNGWYIDLNLSNEAKQRILFKFAAIAKLKVFDDWTWEVLP